MDVLSMISIADDDDDDLRSATAEMLDKIHARADFATGIAFETEFLHIPVFTQFPPFLIHGQRLDKALSLSLSLSVFVHDTMQSDDIAQ
jgi:hypothetical protein